MRSNSDYCQNYSINQSRQKVDTPIFKMALKKDSTSIPSDSDLGTQNPRS